MSVDISMLGMPELERKLKKLVEKDQKAIVRSALRKSSTRNKNRVAANILRMGLVETGNLYKSFKSAKNISRSNNKSIIRIGIALPTRAELDIDPSDKFYYPTALEYGGHSYIRPAVDQHRDAEIRKIGLDIGNGIKKKAK